MVTDRLTHRLTEMPHNDPAQYTVLGWVKNNNKLSLGLNLNTKILDGIKKKVGTCRFLMNTPHNFMNIISYLICI